MYFRFLPLWFACVGYSIAAEAGKVIFEDDFNRSSDPAVFEDIGNGWVTNSKQVGGAKTAQAEIREGALYLSIREGAGHRVSIRHGFDFRDGQLSMKILLPGAEDTIVLDFADPQEKSVHAGHLFAVTFSADSTGIEDLKTGRASTVKEGKGKVSGKDLRGKKAKFEKGLGTGAWKSVSIAIKGELLVVSIDGEKIGELSSEGFAHPVKRWLRIAVPNKAAVDDLILASDD